MIQYSRIFVQTKIQMFQTRIITIQIINRISAGDPFLPLFSRDSLARTSIKCNNMVRSGTRQIKNEEYYKKDEK